MALNVGVDEDGIGVKLVERPVEIGEEELLVEMELFGVLCGEGGVGLGDAYQLYIRIFGERAEEAAGVVMDESGDYYADGRLCGDGNAAEKQKEQGQKWSEEP